MNQQNTGTATPKIPISAITVNKNHYIDTHGHAPRGRGGWIFEIGTEQLNFNGTYSEAVREAKRYAADVDTYDIVVCS